jgi:hypothetical protein
MKRTPMKRSNPKRKAEAFAKSYGSGDRCAFVAALPCSVLGCQNKPSENAHVGNNAGAGLKGEADTICPLCGFHHLEYHTIGRDSFALKYRFDYGYAARMTELSWSLVNPEAK